MKQTTKRFISFGIFSLFFSAFLVFAVLFALIEKTVFLVLMIISLMCALGVVAYDFFSFEKRKNASKTGSVEKSLKTEDK